MKKMNQIKTLSDLIFLFQCLDLSLQDEFYLNYKCTDIPAEELESIHKSKYSVMQNTLYNCISILVAARDKLITRDK